MSRGPAGATVDGLDTFDDLLARWTDAEARGDTATLDAVLHTEFQGDGPTGYVLAKDEWLERHRSGDLVHHAFTWEKTFARAQGTAVYARGVQSQDTRYRGDDCSGRFLATLVAVRRDDGGWAIVNLQLSPLDEPEPGGNRS
jgi:hypothetical protein